MENEEEIYVRDFSVRLFRDSKRVEKLASKAKALLFQYSGDAFVEKENMLEECGVVNTPTLKRHAVDCKRLTETDRKRITHLLELLLTRQSQESKTENYSETLRYMLEHDCKLEQEALHQETI